MKHPIFLKAGHIHIVFLRTGILPSLLLSAGLLIICLTKSRESISSIPLSTSDSPSFILKARGPTLSSSKYGESTIFCLCNGCGSLFLYDLVYLFLFLPCPGLLWHFSCICWLTVARGRMPGSWRKSGSMSVSAKIKAFTRACDP